MMKCQFQIASSRCVLPVFDIQKGKSFRNDDGKDGENCGGVD